MMKLMIILSCISYISKNPNGNYAKENVSSIESIVGRFNTSLENKKLVVCNKFLDNNKLKCVFEVNQKMQPVRVTEIEHKDRKHFIKEQVIENLVSGFNNDFYTLLFNYFKKRDINKFYPSNIPATEASKQAYDLFIGAHKSYLVEAFQDYQNFFFLYF